jgi:uncharacterized membrane protein YphA (DoxX/SURF4 family)
MNRTQAPITLLARLLLAYIFLIEGLGKLAAYSLTQRYMEEHGILGSLLPFVIMTELGAGALVAIGHAWQVSRSLASASSQHSCSMPTGPMPSR